MDRLAHDLFSGSDAGYGQIFERNPLPMWAYDVQTLKIVAANSAAQAFYGYSRPEFVRLSVTDLHPQDDLARLHANLELPLIERVAQRAWRHQRRNGDLIDVEIVTQDLMLGPASVRMVMVTDLTEQHRLAQEQAKLMRRLTHVFESMSDAFFMLDRSWQFSYLNGQAEKVLRRSRDELLGRNVWQKYPAAVGSIFQIQYERAMADGCMVAFEAPDADGRNTWVAVTAYPSTDGLAVYFRDVTERRRAVQALEAEREMLAAVINASNDAIVSCDVNGCIKMFNPGAERIFGRTRQSMEGQTIDLLLPQDLRAKHRHYLRSFADSGTVSRALGWGKPLQGFRSDGQVLELQVIISKVGMGPQALLIACLRDVTERVRGDAELQRSRQQLSDLTQRLMSQERALVKGMAQTLHDHLGQTMAAVRMAHETVLTLQESLHLVPPPEVARLQGQMGVLIGHAIGQIRQVLVDLRPPLLEEQGFTAALDNELRNRSLAQPQIDISFHVAPACALLRWPGGVEYAAFMVAREAVENALRHSGSPAVVVRLSGNASNLHLEVADNGVGIAGEAPEEKTRHLGILGMRERAQAIGASVTVDSGPGRGTSVSFNWSSKP